MKTAQPKIILAAFAFVFALIGLAFPFAHHTYSPEANLKIIADISGYGLVIPAYSLFFFGLAFVLLLAKRSGKYIVLLISALNLAFLFYLRTVLLTNEVTYPNDLSPAEGYYALLVSSFILLVVGLLDFVEVKQKVTTGYPES